MKTEKRKLNVENAFANADACIVCGIAGCVPAPWVVLLYGALVVLIGGGSGE